MFKNMDNVTIKELTELAHAKQVRIEINIEPDGYGTRENMTIEPWEKYEPAACPYGEPIIYVRTRDKE